MMIQRAYRYRFYPTKKQEILLSQLFGCCRFVFNYFLQEKQRVWKEEGRILSYRECSEKISSLKEKFPWLKEVSSVPLRQVLRHLEKAYKAFFTKTAKFPRFKKKHGKQSACFMKNAFTYRDRKTSLAKDSSPLDIRWSRRFSGIPSSLHLSKDPSGRYFVSILVEEEIHSLPFLHKSVGVDFGLINTVITSDKQKKQPSKFLRRSLKQLRHKQKTLSRRVKASANWVKAKKSVAGLHAKIKDTRIDFLHKISKKLIDENQVMTFETLHVKGMMKNRHLALSIGGSSWGTLLSFVKYKAECYGREFIQLDRFFPSSKMCRCCKSVNHALTLIERSWQCPVCQTILERDENSALVINEEGLKKSKMIPWGSRDFKPVETV